MDYASGELKITNNTYSIHHYSASWHSEKERYAFLLQRRFNKIFPKRLSSILGTFVAILKYDGVFHSLKWIIKRK